MLKYVPNDAVGKMHVTVQKKEELNLIMCMNVKYRKVILLVQIDVIDTALRASANQLPSWHSIVPRKEIKVSTVDEFQVSKFLVI